MGRTTTATVTKLPTSRAAAMLRELVVDSFAGGGGASEGITRALGRAPDLAINHDPHAVQVHELNHPGTLHLCQDVLEVDPASVCAGRRLGLLWASPDCTHFSRAKSGKPVDGKIRGLAWAVVEWCKVAAPRVVILENVPEFQTWGPLDENNKPIKSRKGETFRRWVGQLRAEGYAVEWRVLRASDYGTPTTRERLFLVARNDGAPIVWPEATHADEPVAAATCIDWSILGAKVTSKLAKKTRERIAKGTERYIAGADADPYVVELSDGRKVAAWIARHFGGVVGRSIREPLPTVTKVDHHGLVTTELVEDDEGDIEVDGVTYRAGVTAHRMLQPHELAAAMGFGPGYQLVGTKRAQTARIGNAVCPPLAEAIVAANYRPE